MLHPHIEVRGSSIEGRGLFAKAAIQRGETLWRKEQNERYFTRSEIDALSADERERFFNYSYQVGPDAFYGTPQGEALDDADYMNHSCEPNTWFEADGSMTAMKDIEPNEEITYDYATSEGRNDFRLNCRCGAPSCRKVVRGSDLREDQRLREKYGEHAMPHVL